MARYQVFAQNEQGTTGEAPKLEAEDAESAEAQYRSRPDAFPVVTHVQKVD